MKGEPRSYIMCYGKQHLNAEGKNMKNDFFKHEKILLLMNFTVFEGAEHAKYFR